MRSLVFVMTVVAAVLSVSARDIPNRIVGGSDAPDGKYPYQVSLRTYNHFCGGSIINKRWIVTAAHCIYGSNARLIRVVAGTNLLSEYGDNYPVDLLLPNPKFDPSSVENDIGLIRVDRDIVFNSKVQPIKLPNEDFTKEDYPALLSGWGRISIGSLAPNNLQHINLTVISQSSCQDYHRGIKHSHICTFTKSGEGACYGDSGGPLAADGVLIGVVSTGIPCAVGFPDIFTRVWAFIDWINQNTKI